MDSELRGWLLIHRGWGQDLEIRDENGKPLLVVRVFLRRPLRAMGCTALACAAAMIIVGKLLDHWGVDPGIVVLSTLGAFVVTLVGTLFPAMFRLNRLRFCRPETGEVSWTIHERPPWARSDGGTYRVLDATGATLAYLVEGFRAVDSNHDVLVALHRTVEPRLPADFVEKHGLADDRLHQGYSEIDGRQQRVGSIRRASPLLDAALVELSDQAGEDPRIALALAVFYEATTPSMEDYELARARGVVTVPVQPPRR